MKALSANAFGQAVTVIAQLVGLPVFLFFWGANIYGQYLVLTAIPTYLAMSDLGFASAAANQMTMQSARGDVRGATCTFQTTFLILTSLSFGILSLLVAIAWAAGDSARILNISAISEPKEVSALALLALQVFAGMLSGLMWGALRAEGKYGESVFAGNLLRLFEFGVQLVALVVGSDILEVIVWGTAARYISLLIAARLLRKFAPSYQFGFRHANLMAAKELLPASLSFLVIPLSSGLYLQGFTILVANTLGPTELVAFTAMRTIARVMNQGMAMINYSIWPEISRAFGRGDRALARSLHLRACQCSIAIASMLAILLVFSGRWIWVSWTHSVFAFDSAAFNVLVLASLINAAWYASSVVPTATNQNKRLAWLYLGYSSFALFLGDILMRRLGLLGASVAVLTAECVMSIAVIRASLALLEQPARSYAQAMLDVKDMVRWLKSFKSGGEVGVDTPKVAERS